MHVCTVELSCVVLMSMDVLCWFWHACVHNGVVLCCVDVHGCVMLVLACACIHSGVVLCCVLLGSSHTSTWCLMGTSNCCWMAK